MFPAADLHPVLQAAARGELPDWTRAGADRRSHMRRVAELMSTWAARLALSNRDALRWPAAGFLHDALRDASPEELDDRLREGPDHGGDRPDDDHDAARDHGRAGEPRSLRAELERHEGALPAAFLHGPAAASAMRTAGVSDDSVLRAVAFHTTGHPRLDLLGVALYCADFLEPGREHHDERRAGLSRKFPDDPAGVAREVVRVRIHYLLRRKASIHTLTVGLWNRLLTGEPLQA